MAEAAERQAGAGVGACSIWRRAVGTGEVPGEDSGALSWAAGPDDRWLGEGGGVIGVGWHVQTRLTTRNWVGREAEKRVGAEWPWGPLLRWAP